MSGKRISSLPTLSRSDFNAETDYVIVQKANGDIYKMLGGGGTFAEALLSRVPIADSSSLDLVVQSTGSIEFFDENMFALDSALTVDISIKNIDNGTTRPRNSADTLDQVSIGSARTVVFTKTSNFNSLGGVIIGSSQRHHFGPFRTTYRQAIHTGHRTSWNKYFLDTVYYVTYSTTVDSLRLDFYGFYTGRHVSGPSWWSGSTYQPNHAHLYGSAQNVEITASINGTKQP